MFSLHFHVPFPLLALDSVGYYNYKTRHSILRPDKYHRLSLLEPVTTVTILSGKADIMNPGDVILSDCLRLLVREHALVKGITDLDREEFLAIQVYPDGAWKNVASWPVRNYRAMVVDSDHPHTTSKAAYVWRHATDRQLHESVCARSRGATLELAGYLQEAVTCVERKIHPLPIESNNPLCKNICKWRKLAEERSSEFMHILTSRSCAYRQPSVALQDTPTYCWYRQFVLTRRCTAAFCLPL